MDKVSIDRMAALRALCALDSVRRDQIDFYREHLPGRDLHLAQELERIDKAIAEFESALRMQPKVAYRLVPRRRSLVPVEAPRAA